MTRYIAVPVWFPNYRKNGKVLAVLPGTDPLGDPDEVGVGDTEEEAFSDLLTKLGYEEAVPWGASPVEQTKGLVRYVVESNEK